MRALTGVGLYVGAGSRGRGRYAPKLAAFEPHRHALQVQSYNFVIKIGDTRGAVSAVDPARFIMTWG